MKTQDADTDRRGHAGLAGMAFYLLFGPIVWALHLAIVYGAHTILCAHTPASDILGINGVVLTVIAATAVALLLLLIAALPRHSRSCAPREPSAHLFYRRMMLLLASLSACGVAWAGAAALIVSPCVALR